MIGLGAWNEMVLGAFPADDRVSTPSNTVAFTAAATPGSAPTTYAYAPPVEGCIKTLKGVHTLIDVNGCSGAVCAWPVITSAVATRAASRADVVLMFAMALALAQ